MAHPNRRRTGWLTAVVFLALATTAVTLIPSLQWVNRTFPGFFLYGNLTVAPYFLPHWSGQQAGLSFLDRVVAVDGETIAAPEQIYDRLRRSPAQEPIRYTVERRGETIELAIPPMRFSFQDWLLSSGIYLLGGLGFLIIGFAPFYMRSSAPAAPVLFFMASAISLWFVVTFDFMTARHWPLAVRPFALVLTCGAVIHLGLALTRTREALKKLRRRLALVYAASALLGTFFVATFHGPLEIWRWSQRLSYGYCLLAASLLLTFLVAALRRPASALERSRLRVVLFGALLGLCVPAFGTVLTSFFSWSIPYNVSFIPVVFFPLSVAYALLKYSLFDLDVALKVGLIRAALASSLLLIYGLLVSVLGVGIGVYAEDAPVPIFFSILVVVIFNPLLRWIEAAVDRYVYRKEYDPRQLQTDASALLRSLSRPQTVAEKSLKLIGERIGLDAAHLFFFFSADTGGPVIASLHAEADAARDLFLSRLHRLWSAHFGIARKGASKNEWLTDSAGREDREELAHVLTALKSELVIAIVFQDEVRGILALGKKNSGREFNGDDFALLCALADQLALALENGTLFEDSERSKESYRRLYDESQALNRRLIETDRQKKDFVANISHELRTPVCTILGYAEVLRDPAFAGDRHAILDRVATHGHELSQLMDNLLQFCRMESGSLSVALREMKVAEVFQALEIVARRLIRGRPIQFRVEIESSLETVLTDPEKFQQIMMHLLTNAVKFTERGEIAVGVRQTWERDEPFVECWIGDTGIGISRQDQEAIFEDFRQLERSSTRHYGGTGMGLSLCKKLAHSLRGRIEVRSEVGKGSVFSLILPVPRPQAEPAAPQAEAA
jgi:signal transduction histidine kinase